MSEYSDQNQPDAGNKPECGDSSTDAPNLEAHRNTIGQMLQGLSDKGIDITSIAQRAGISSTDVDQLSHDDLLTLVTYVAHNHPDVLQTVGQRIPAVQGLLGLFSGGQLGRLLQGLCGSGPQERS